MKISCIIVEYEPLAMKRTKSYVLKTPDLELLGCFENAIEAINFLKSNQVNLIFLDIQMDEINSVELIESFNANSKIIFTTAFVEYAIKGYELNVLDYLLKPFSYDRFLQAINKFEAVSQDPVNFVFIKDGYSIVKVYLDQILYIEGMGDYRCVHTTTNKKIMTLQTFSEIQQLLSNHKFIRVHKSYLISLSKIDIIDRNYVEIGKKRIPISATYKEAFHQQIQSKDH